MKGSLFFLNIREKQVKLMTQKRYKIKWCIPVIDVDVIDVGSGISVNVNKQTTIIKYSHPCKYA